ncbi:hypothetical protein J4233_01195 [Candidatus Pacearchaeota archaeon]|nr:hypothetical protein [Candidatus Pacearchaeota archaeon]
MNFQNAKSFASKNKFLLLVFVLTTAFFLVQHYWDLSWDFAAYVINAKYFFHGGDYMEVYRAPLASLLLGPLLIFGKLGEFVYVFFVSVLFLIANTKLSDSLHQKYFYKYNTSKEQLRTIFYILSLNGFVIFHGTLVGTELLALSFFELFLAYFIANKYSGHFLALAVLSRYNFMIFFPLQLFNKKPKKIILNVLLFFAVLLPWLVFNYVKWGNFFTSIVDSYFLNVFSRQDLVQPFNFYDILLSLNWTIPLMIIGIFIALKSFRTNKKQSLIPLLFLTILAVIIYDYATTPFKIARYLFSISLPAAFFSTMAILYLKEKFPKINKLVASFLFLIFIFSIVSVISIYQIKNLDDYGKIYVDASEKIEELNLTHCAIRTSHWIPMYYYTNNAYYLYGVRAAMSDNQAVLIFKNNLASEDHLDEISAESDKTIFENDDLLIVANKNYSSSNCLKRSGWDGPMLPETCEIVDLKIENPSIKNISKKICLAFNKK